jgi:hypothetical protein
VLSIRKALVEQDMLLIQHLLVQLDLRAQQVEVVQQLDLLERKARQVQLVLLVLKDLRVLKDQLEM